MRLPPDHSCLMDITVLGSKNICRSFGGWFPEDMEEGFRGVKRIFEMSLSVGEPEFERVLL